jgi:hypothetical protein
MGYNMVINIKKKSDETSADDTNKTTPRRRQLRSRLGRQNSTGLQNGVDMLIEEEEDDNDNDDDNDSDENNEDEDDDDDDDDSDDSDDDDDVDEEENEQETMMTMMGMTMRMTMMTMMERMTKMMNMKKTSWMLRLKVVRIVKTIKQHTCRPLSTLMTMNHTFRRSILVEKRKDLEMKMKLLAWWKNLKILG